jgi:hypothetical protein
MQCMTCTRSWIAALVLVAGTANAQPSTECRVVVTLAPDDVRAEIEAWVRAEPRCVRELEVRVVPTEDGLYLSATDGRGHVRERVVPDAQSAAVLVVSWMADDTLGPRLPSRAAVEPPAEAAPTYADDPEIPTEVMAPGVIRSIRRRDDGRRWLTFGAIGSGREQRGVRASIDLLAGRTWSLGIAGGGQGDHGDEDEDDEPGTGQVRVVIAATRSLGRLSVRAQLGFGVDATKPEDDTMERTEMDSAHGEHPRIVPAVEVGVLAKLRIKNAWGIVGGPIVSATHDARPTLSMFLGVQRGL